LIETVFQLLDQCGIDCFDLDCFLLFHHLPRFDMGLFQTFLAIQRLASPALLPGLGLAFLAFIRVLSNESHLLQMKVFEPILSLLQSGEFGYAIRCCQKLLHFSRQATCCLILSHLPQELIARLPELGIANLSRALKFLASAIELNHQNHRFLSSLEPSSFLVSLDDGETDLAQSAMELLTKLMENNWFLARIDPDAFLGLIFPHIAVGPFRARIAGLSCLCQILRGFPDAVGQLLLEGSNCKAILEFVWSDNDVAVGQALEVCLFLIDRSPDVRDCLLEFAEWFDPLLGSENEMIQEKTELLMRQIIGSSEAHPWW
jgi:hypothetical protein